MTTILQDYAELPKLFQDQLKQLSGYFENPNTIHYLTQTPFYQKHVDEESSDKFRRILLRMTIFQMFSPSDILDQTSSRPNKYQKTQIPLQIKSRDLISYDQENWVRLNKLIAVGRHVRVFSGFLHDRDPVVMKWYQSGPKNMSFEINIYRQLWKLGCPLPHFYSDFKFWNQPVLILEKLEPLDSSDHPYQVGFEILEQLKTVHQICIHNDIKPGNVMKKNQHGSPEYFLIDYGGVTQERLKHGYRRKVWSLRWTSQRMHEDNQVTTARHDFLELGYTLKYLQNLRTGEDKIRSGFHGRLKRYMEAVHKMDSISDNDYVTLQHILAN